MFKIGAAQNWEFSIHHLLLFFFYFNSYSSAQEEVIYRTANLSTSWLNTGSINYVGVGPNGSWTFLDGSNLRPVLLHQRDERDYALGFFRFGNWNTSNSFFLVILMFEMDTLGTDSPAAVIWTANRDHAVRENATLEFDAHGNLILRDTDGTLVWSTNTTGLPATTVLLELSNLLLVNSSFSTSDSESTGVFWQSYNHPTDTWFDTQKLQLGGRLTSSMTASNLSSGMFYLTMTDVGLQAFLESDPPQLYATLLRCDSGSRYVRTPFGFLDCASSYIQNSGYIGTNNFIKLDPDGRLKYYTMLSNRFTQNELFEDGCTYAIFCGSYGVCTNGLCDCPMGDGNLSYFQQTSPGEPQKGCDPITPLSCQDTHLHTFLELPHVTYNDFVPSLLNVDAESCKQACLNNCSCIAAMFHCQHNNFSSGNCSLHSHLLSLTSAQDMDGSRSHTFLKVQNAPPGVPSKAKTSSSLVRILIPTLLVGLLFVCLVAGWRYYYIVMIKKVEDSEEEAEDVVVEGLTRFTLEDLRSATQDFRVKLGRGGFGSVFEGTLHNGTKVAVKRLENLAGKDFLAEVITIGSIHHYNLVKLLGYCSRRSNKLLVYEHVANGSLDKWIFHQNRAQTLIWETRHKIILGIARGLEYLHVHCDPNVIHFDIKPQNILLDGEFNVKIADFGLAKLIDRDQSQVLLTRAKGTLGYVAPELFTGRNISTKVDVYSFGILILETMCGRKNIVSTQVDLLIDLVRIKAEEDQLAELIDVVLQPNTEAAVKMIEVAIWCLQPPSKRPSVSMVVNVLVGLTDVEPITNYEFLSMVQFGNPLEGKPSVSPPPEASIISGPR